MIINDGQFRKGMTPWNKGYNKKDYLQLGNSGVKIGNIPWNKNTKGLMPKPWNKGNKNGKELICQLCGKLYYVSKARLENSKYCSWECFSKSKTLIIGEEHPLYTSLNIKCEWCGKIYKEKPIIIKTYNHHFCSRICAGSYAASHQNRISNIEKKLSEYLIENKISFICQFKFKLGVADFFIKPNLIIEVDGNYWHNLPKVKERDERKTLYLEGEGYKVLRLWEKDINKYPQKCINRILEMAKE